MTDVSRETSRQIASIWRSHPILSKALILVVLTIMIPFILTLTFFILLPLVFFILGIFLLLRWFSMATTDDSHVNIGDMKLPTFYSSVRGDIKVYIFFMPVVGVVFGGIHCVGWFFNFPSSGEAILWQVSSAVLTGVAFIFPLLFFLISSNRLLDPVFIIILLVYVVSRLLLLVEAFISLRHLTPGMLALVKWTSFIPHI